MLLNYLSLFLFEAGIAHAIFSFICRRIYYFWNNGHHTDSPNEILAQHIVPLDMKRCICHFLKWQIHPFISKGANYAMKSIWFGSYMEIYAILAADGLAFKCCLAEKCDGIVLSNGCLGSNNSLKGPLGMRHFQCCQFWKSNLYEAI